MGGFVRQVLEGDVEFRSNGTKGFSYSTPSIPIFIKATPSTRKTYTGSTSKTGNSASRSIIAKYNNTPRSRSTTALSRVICVKAPCNPVPNQNRQLRPVQDLTKHLRPMRLENPAPARTSKRAAEVNKQAQKHRQRLEQLHKKRDAQLQASKRQNKLRTKQRNLRAKCLQSPYAKQCRGLQAQHTRIPGR